MVSVRFPPRSLPLNLNNSSVILQTRKKKYFSETGLFATRTRYQERMSCNRSVQTFQVISVTMLNKDTLQFDNGPRPLNRFREFLEERLVNYLVIKAENNFTSTSSQVLMAAWLFANNSNSFILLLHKGISSVHTGWLLLGPGKPGLKRVFLLRVTAFEFCNLHEREVIMFDFGSDGLFRTSFLEIKTSVRHSLLQPRHNNELGANQLTRELQKTLEGVPR